MLLPFQIAHLHHVALRPTFDRIKIMAFLQ